MIFRSISEGNSANILSGVRAVFMPNASPRFNLSGRPACSSLLGTTDHRFLPERLSSGRMYHGISTGLSSETFGISWFSSSTVTIWSARALTIGIPSPDKQSRSESSTCSTNLIFRLSMDLVSSLFPIVRRNFLAFVLHLASDDRGAKPLASSPKCRPRTNL